MIRSRGQGSLIFFDWISKLGRIGSIVRVVAGVDFPLLVDFFVPTVLDSELLSVAAPILASISESAENGHSEELVINAQVSLDLVSIYSSKTSSTPIRICERWLASRFVKL